jgi:hypothetical protein
MSTYLTSYMRQASAPNITYTGKVMSTHLTSYMRQAGAPTSSASLQTGSTTVSALPPQQNLSLNNYFFADFVVVQSAWGMTQGCVMPFSGFIIRAIGEKVRASFSSSSCPESKDQKEAKSRFKTLDFPEILDFFCYSQTLDQSLFSLKNLKIQRQVWIFLQDFLVLILLHININYFINKL